MKSILTLTLLSLLACVAVNGLVPVKLNEEQKAKAIQIAAECIQQEKVTQEAVMAFAKGDFTKNDRSLKCYANCFLTKSGVMVDGVLQKQVIIDKMGPHVGEEKIKATLEKCGAVKGSDNCETAFMMFECYHKEHADLA